MRPASFGGFSALKTEPERAPLMPPRWRVTKKFRRVLRKKLPEMQASILECVRRLADDPHHPGLHSHKVHGTRGVFEAYVDNANRLTFHWDSGVMVLRNNCNHDILKQNP